MSAQQVAVPPPLVFDRVTVVDVAEGHLIPDQRVVVVGSRIQRVGPVAAVALPKRARVVDAHGQYLIPGFWDMHIHALHYATDIFYPFFIANGITGIRDAASNVPLDTLRRWRQEIWAGARVGPPRQILSGKAIHGRLDRACSGPLLPFHTCVADSASARQLVDSLKAAGADMIKMYDLSAPMYFVLAAEARRVGIPFGGHAEQVTATDASDSGAAIIDHLNSAGGMEKLCWDSSASMAQCQPVAERFRRNGTWFVPTLLALTSVRQASAGPAAQFLATQFPQFASAFWAGAAVRYSDWLRDSGNVEHPGGTSPPSAARNAGGLLQIMERVGFPILAGTDMNPPYMRYLLPGFALHTELAMYVAEGLTPLEALQTATLNPAKFWHATDSLGTVAPGKLADLVLLDANPLQDIRNTAAIRAVVANGRYFDRAALDALLAAVQARGKQEGPCLGRMQQQGCDGK